MTEPWSPLHAYVADGGGTDEEMIRIAREGIAKGDEATIDLVHFLLNAGVQDDDLRLAFEDALRDLDDRPPLERALAAKDEAELYVALRSLLTSAEPPDATIAGAAVSMLHIAHVADPEDRLRVAMESARVVLNEGIRLRDWILDGGAPPS